MVKRKQCIAICLFAGVIVFFCSCSLGLVWDRGHYVDDHYVPKKPNYKFKDKKNNRVPSNLDTANVYREVGIYSDGILQDKTRDFYFLKFYPKGRVLEFQIFSSSEPEVLQMSYEEVLSISDVDTEHGYYYSKDGEKIQIEKFEHSSINAWPVTGTYEIDNYYLNAAGDTLTKRNPKSNYIRIYVKEKTPRVLEDYLVTW